LLPKTLSQSTLDERDRAFATELVYGTLRMQGRHDWILQQVSDRPWHEVDEALVDVARMGAHQLFEMRVPTHAAVSATVELGRKVLGESKASFLNAILRKVSQKSLDDYVSEISEITDEIQRLSVLHSHPEWIVSSYLDQLGSLQEVEKLLTANNVAPRPTLVSWPGLSTQQDLVDIGAIPTLYSPFGGVFDGSPGSLDLVISHKEIGSLQVPPGLQNLAKINLFEVSSLLNTSIPNEFDSLTNSLPPPSSLELANTSPVNL
jgi:16S rRNA (cytosine967-C5)-methyltransferase